MGYFFDTLIFIMFFCSMMLLMIRYILEKNPLLVKKRINLFLACLGMIGLRMLVPLEFPFVRQFKGHYIIRNIQTFLARPIPFTKRFGLSPFTIINNLWMVGAICFLTRLICQYMIAVYKVHRMNQVSDDRIARMIIEITESYRRRILFNVVTTDRTTSPLVFGIFKPYIILPSIVLDDEALYYILEHEIAHYYHGDLLFKFLMEVGKAVWWWNPLLYFVKSQISVLMEINADTKVTEKLDDYGKISYLQCLLKMAKFQGKGRKKEFMSAFNSDNVISIPKRANIVLGSQNTYNHKCFLINLIPTVFIVVFALIMPNLFTMDTGLGIPYEEDCEGYIFEINKDNSFFIQLEDGTFDLYVDQQFIVNITHTSFCEERIPVYLSLEEALTE